MNFSNNNLFEFGNDVELSRQIDIKRARRETPGCQRIIHFNNAGAGLMPECVTEAITRHLELESMTGGYEAADIVEETLLRLYESAATLINCDPLDIAIVENATRAWDMAFYAFKFQPGDRILTAQSEYASNYLAYLQVARHTGVIIEAVPSDTEGQISINHLDNMIDKRVKLISAPHVPTNSGLVNPATEIGKIARANKIPFILDACQSVGQIPIDVEDIGCDILTTTGRKYLRGPRGTGFLFVHPLILDRLEPPFIDMHAAEWTGKYDYSLRTDAKRFETWESFVGGKIGLCRAIEYAMEWEIELIYQRIQMLATKLRTSLSQISGITVQDIGAEKCGIVTFTKLNVEATEVKVELAKENINVSVSPSSSTLLDMEHRKLEAVVRASLHYYNTEDEITRFIEVLETIS